MNITNQVSADDRDLLFALMKADDESVHFLWNRQTGQVTQLGRQMLPDNENDPLGFMRQNGWIEEQSLHVFDVFCGQFREGIVLGTERGTLTADVSMKLSAEAPFRLHHIYALLLRDAAGKICFAHINIRPYSEREIFDKGVLSVFSSDKAPQFFGQRISRMMAQHAEDGIAFIQFDIERFKLINDTYGVETGDAVLKFLSDTLSIVCKDDQPFCRLTADVFMIVIPFREEQEILDFIHLLESVLYGFEGIDYRLIFGVAIAEDKTLHTRRLGDNATLARQSIKGNALNNIGFYNGSLKTELYRTHSIEDDMERGLQSHEFVMYLQPKHSISTGRIIGAEALTRWIHGKRGMIAPSEFIPVFEKNGFILKLDQLIWECACQKIRAWIDEGIAPVPISVNVSREYLNTFDVAGKLLELVHRYRIPMGLLEVEITESVDAEDTAAVVRRLKDLGFTMLMDDFGSGYSSLNMLKTTQFDVLKIDRSFLSEFMESDRGRKIIAHTISMSRDIGLDIVAEGVETVEQAGFLRDCGCDSAQGFFYSRPIPAAAFDQRLREVNGI